MTIKERPMKRKMMIAALALISCIACVFGMTACGHTHDYEDRVVAPTCTEGGYTEHVCSCGESYRDNEVPARHTLTTVAEQQATCTEKGWEAYETCSRCDYTTYKEIAALGHASVQHEAKAATCTEKGWGAYETCSRCDYTTYKEISALEHDYLDGTCTRCGEKVPERLTYTLNSDAYLVTGIGTCTDTDIVIPATYNNLPVTSIGDNAFENCSNLTSITIPNSVTSIGHGAFENCSSLTSITIGNSVTSIGNYAFYSCGGLTSITIPDSVTSIGMSAFYGCSGLTSITIPDKVTSIGKYAFYGCSGLKSITIPDGVTDIGRYAFSGCNSLENITVAGGNKKYYSVGNCVIETATKKLIAGCKNSVIPTDGSVTFIDGGVFEGCSGLTSITIPSSVTSIGDYAFQYCYKLTSITYQGTKAQWNAITKGLFWDYETDNYTIHCTDGDI